MLDIGTEEGSLKLDEVGERALGVINAVERNKVFFTHTGESVLDLGTANQYRRLEPVGFKYWKVIALGMLWLEASTADEDPVVIFGRVGDTNAYGTMTSAITGGEKFNTTDVQKYDPLDILANEIIAETSATLAVTWTEGAEFNVWNARPVEFLITEAAIAGMSSGMVRPFMVIEVKTRGKW